MDMWICMLKLRTHICKLIWKKISVWRAFLSIQIELQGSWSYNPKKIEVLGGPDEQNLNLIGFAIQ